MAKAKRDKSRKQKLTNFKNKQKSKKMSNTLPKSPIAQQHPIWNSNDTIEMNGLEFEAIYNFLANFRNAVMAGESILQKNMQSGKVTWVYKDAEGKEVPQDVVLAYQKAVQEYFLKQQQNGQSAAQTEAVDPNSPITAEEQKNLPKIDALVDATGKPLTP